MTQGDIQIQPLTTWPEMIALAELERRVWASSPEFIIQPHWLLSIAANGGLVLGALDGEQVVGGAVATLGAASADASRPAMANLKLNSELVVVQEDYRRRGIGYRLKLAQYQFAVQRGIRLMTWVFDPLHGEHAHLTVRKLGAVIDQYYPDYYPDPPRAAGVPESTDRVQADWWLTSGRALQRVKKGRAPLTLGQYLEGETRILNPTTLDSRLLPVPADDFIEPPGALGLIEIPNQLSQVQQADSGLARAWREHVRAVIMAVMAQGFILTDFVHETHKGRPRSFYVCSHEGTLRQFDRNFNQN